MKVLKKINIKNILFIDIETSTSVKELDINSSLFDAWAYVKRRNNETDEELVEMYGNQAALYADFGRVVCISVGMLSNQGFKMKTFNDLDEKKQIADFYEMLDGFNGDYLCGHNIKQFDIPYIAKRGMIHNIPPHALLDTSGEKPWTMDWLLDTKELWQMGSFDRTSLIALTNALGIQSPKEDLQGKDVPKYFWENPKGHIQRISDYCERDVIAVYKVIEHLKNLGKDKKLPLEKTPLIKHLFDGGAYGTEQKKRLKEVFDEMTPEERELGYDILNAIVSTAKGKKTKITKTHIKTLKESYN
jgi:DNA polymerase elongation subunit (family B)